MKPLILLLSTVFLIIGCSSNSGNSTDPLATNESGLTDSESQVLNPESLESIPLVQIPLNQPTTRVDFGITVPAYMSDSLQLRIVWGDQEMDVQWIGDEYWTATTEYQTNTEQLLTVTFYDNNGAIVLGRFEQLYKTGLNTSEAFDIAADQFDTKNWDADEDGFSNLSELVAGTDPLQDEELSLEVRDIISPHSSVFIAESFSRKIPAERPFLFDFEEITPISDTGPPWGGPQKTVSINIDDNGDGSFYDFYQYRPLDTRTYTATRTNSGNSITWAGEQRKYEGWDVDSWSDTTSFTTQISVIDESTRSFVGESQWRYYFSAAYARSATRQSEYDLTGILVDGTKLCTPIAGTIVTTLVTNKHYSVVPRHEKTTITKETADPYWKYTQVNVEDETILAQYYGRKLNTRVFQGLYPEGSLLISGAENETNFKCEFADF